MISLRNHDSTRIWVRNNLTGRHHSDGFCMLLHQGAHQNCTFCYSTLYAPWKRTRHVTCDLPFAQTWVEEEKWGVVSGQRMCRTHLRPFRKFNAGILWKPGRKRPQEKFIRHTREKSCPFVLILIVPIHQKRLGPISVAQAVPNCTAPKRRGIFALHLC
jgi:hypothetical protein